MPTDSIGKADQGIGINEGDKLRFYEVSFSGLRGLGQHAGSQIFVKFASIRARKARREQNHHVALQCFADLIKDDYLGPAIGGVWESTMVNPMCPIVRDGNAYGVVLERVAPDGFHVRESG